MTTAGSNIACTVIGLFMWSSITHADALKPPTGAPYLTRDGAVAIIGNDGMQTLMEQLNAQFVRQHPDFRFALTAKGSSTAIAALTAGVAAIAPMSREPWLGEKAGFEQVKGYAPTEIRIGYSGFGPRAPHKTPPAIYVNSKNPLPGLNMTQLAQIITAGQVKGDLNTWGQVGLSAPWAQRRIHVYGLRDDGGFATNLRLDKLGGKAFSAKYEALDNREAVIAAVANDPYSIGLTGWVDASKTADNVRVLPLAAKAGEAFKAPDYATVSEGAYPLSAYLHLYVDLKPGEKLPAFIKQYLNLALSDEGQKRVREQRDSEEGYVPLSAADLQKERQKLEAM